MQRRPTTETNKRDLRNEFLQNISICIARSALTPTPKCDICVAKLFTFSTDMHPEFGIYVYQAKGIFSLKQNKTVGIAWVTILDSDGLCE